jgi:3-phytase
MSESDTASPRPSLRRRILVALFAAIALAALAAVPTIYFRFGWLLDPVGEVTAVAETEPIMLHGDRADDIAIWVDPVSPERSVVIGTSKGTHDTWADGGLFVYDLDGRVLQTVKDHGSMNTVDLRLDFPFGGQRIVLVASSNHKHNGISLMAFDPKDRQLRDIAAPRIDTGHRGSGCCLYWDKKKAYVFDVAGTGQIQQFELLASEGKLVAKQVRTFDLGGESEGCVADEATGYVFISQESRGIWRFPVQPESGSDGVMIASIGRHLKGDVEGLAIRPTGASTGYLIASSQGNSRFVIFDRQPPHRFLGAFRIVEGDSIDGCEETDGIAVTSGPVGPRFPGGLFVAHDHANREGGANFKFVPWEPIAKAARLAR